jgi:hypothetical protein
LFEAADKVTDTARTLGDQRRRIVSKAQSDARRREIEKAAFRASSSNALHKCRLSMAAPFGAPGRPWSAEAPDL